MYCGGGAGRQNGKPVKEDGERYLGDGVGDEDVGKDGSDASETGATARDEGQSGRMG